MAKKPAMIDLVPVTDAIDDSKFCRCGRCGTRYSKAKGNFPSSTSEIYLYSGYLPICNKCVETVYQKYLAECGDEAGAVRQFCRYLNLYYSDKLFESAKNAQIDKSMIVKYLARLKSTKYASNTYDDTLEEEGTKWSFLQREAYVNPEPEPVIEEVEEEPIIEPIIEPIVEEVIEEPIPEEWVDAWGEGLHRKDYEWLEKRYYHYWNQMSDVDKHDIGNEPLIRQICNLEFEIRASKGTGKTIEKNVNTLNALVKSMNWTPTQSKSDDLSAYDKTPFGVWIKRFEDSRPIPEPDDDLKDPDHLKHFIHVYFLGHLCHMMGIKNEYNRLYEEEMERYSVAPPKFEDDETNELYAEIFGESE